MKVTPALADLLIIHVGLGLGQPLQSVVQTTGQAVDVEGVMMRSEMATVVGAAL